MVKNNIQLIVKTILAVLLGVIVAIAVKYC